MFYYNENKKKNKRILKNGAIGAYVYKDGKWRWRIIGHINKKGGTNNISKILRGKINSEKKNQLLKLENGVENMIIC